jgi:5'-nucleotidase
VARCKNVGVIRRRLLPVVLLALPLALAAQRPAVDGGAAAIQLLAFNDFHGNLEPPTGANGRIGQTLAGGAEYLATHVRRAVEQQPNSIIVAAGDLVGASPLISGLFHDEPTVESLNAIGLSFASVGNHEFDRGSRELQRLQRGGCHPVDGCSRDSAAFSGARYQYLSANVIDTATRQPLFPATAVRTIDGVKVGFIGETLKGTPHIVSPAGVKGLTFLDEASTANAHARRLTQQGVRAIVLLIHEGGRQGVVPEDEADPNGCVKFGGAIETIARKLVPEIKVIVSGHTHRAYNCSIAGHLVTSAASLGRVMTRVNLTIDRATGSVTRASAVNEIVTRDVAKDPVLTGIIARYGALAAPIAKRIAGSITAGISRQQNRAGESALGDVVADAHLASARTASGGADVAFMNNSGIRADLVVSAVPPGPSPVTYGELYDVQPFGNTLTLVTMTGDMIRRLLEQQFAQPTPVIEVLQVSAGFSYRYRRDAPAGRHVDPDSIAIDGRQIRPADRVRVVANDFLVNGGLGFTVFAEGTGRSGGELDVDAFAAYFKDHSPVPPGPQDRIVRTD